ncbi:hypothetical protein PC120_g18102 [Phytophthora cactorum]|nr:hypothetical protein PC120_g18102 [Phytophthora cactorum]
MGNAEAVKQVKGGRHHIEEAIYELYRRSLPVQPLYGLPDPKPMVDCDTRVASTATLFQRIIVKYAAFRAYFQHCEKYDKPAVSKKIWLTEWHLMTELEVVTESQADLAWIQVQRIDQVASELMVLLRLAVDRLNSGLRSQRSAITEAKREIAPRSPCRRQCALHWHSGAYATAADQETVDTTSDAAQANRNADVDEVIMEGHRTLRDAHRDVVCAMHATASDDREGATMDAPPNLELVPSIDDGVVSCGATVVSPAQNNHPLRALHEDADQVVQLHRAASSWQ